MPSRLSHSGVATIFDFDAHVGWGIAALHASLGDIDDAFEWLEVAMREKASGLILLRVHRRLDPIRSDPRYGPMVERVGLAD